MNVPYIKEIDEPFAYGYLSAMEKGKYLAMAEGLYQECLVMPIVYDNDVGLFQCARRSYGLGYAARSGVIHQPHVLERKKNAFPDYAEFFQAITEKLELLFPRYQVSLHMDTADLEACSTGACWGGTWGGHSIPDYGGLLELGTAGLRSKIGRYRNVHPYSADFYDALEIVLDAFEMIAEKVREEAYKMAEASADMAEREHFLALSRSMEVCPKNAPYDFLSAAQFFWLFFSYDGYDSPGRLDQIFLPYWKKTPYKESFAILEGMWIGFHKHRAWNVCISGSDEFGNDTTNEISFAMLELVKKHRFQTPNLTMRCHDNTDPALIRSAAEALAMGCGLPTLYNDRVVCKMFEEKLGIPPKDAHNYAMNGCNQIDIQGKSHMGLEDGEVNLYKCLEFVLHRGMCMIDHKKYGLDCGDPIEFETFDAFLAAYKKEIEYITDLCCRCANTKQYISAEVAPSLWRSVMHQGCIEKGKDFKEGGPMYNHGQILMEGLADAVDSLAAIRYHIYEQKNFTMAELITALENDFAENEVMRQMLSEQPARFGNNDDATDALAWEVADHFFNYLLTIPTYRGGWYTGGCSPFMRAAEYGSNVGAGANGRHKADPLIADSIGATPGRDEEGPTALLNSVLKLPHHLAGSGFILQIKFDKAGFAMEEGINNFIALWKTYFENGGQQLSVSVVSQEELLDAKVHPENHRDLIVRVGGYSDYFVNISSDLQDNVIARTGYGR